MNHFKSEYGEYLVTEDNLKYYKSLESKLSKAIADLRLILKNYDYPSVHDNVYIGQINNKIRLIIKEINEDKE